MTYYELMIAGHDVTQTVIVHGFFIFLLGLFIVVVVKVRQK